MAPELPRIGVRLDQELHPHRCIELAVIAETSGYSSLWFAENPLHRAILPALSACALRTERILLGIGILNAYQHHPSLIAMEAGALDELAAGRVLLGIGSGVGSRIARLGFEYRPIAALRDATQIVRALLRGEEASYVGRAFSVNRARLGFRPPRPDMPIYFASMGDRSLALCGELADGLIVSNLCPAGYTQRAAGIVQQGAAVAGRKPLDIVQYVPCAVRADRDEAKHAANRPLARCLPRSGRWATTGRYCARPSCGTAALPKARWLPRSLGCAAARRPTGCSTTALSRLSRLRARPKSALRPRRAIAGRVSMNSY
jgi:5,10-methylenetetrahydromethanopterin reductase